MNHANICVEEEVQIAIQIAIDRFIKNDEAELEFPSSLTSVERSYIHRRCSEMGLVSKSLGKGMNRYLTVRKKQPREVIESSMVLNLGQNSRRVLFTLLHQWPMKLKEKQDIQPKMDQPLSNNFSRCDMNKPSGRLPNGIPQIPSPRSQSKLDGFRVTLPVYGNKNKLVEAIWGNQVVVISGETGSGKTTQIPQFILDESLKRKEVCRIICTQPRRISAVSMAERVAVERGEGVGQTVGYQIRLESRASPRTLLTFCTNGVLLRTLMAGDNSLQSTTHIIVDEVHERDRFSDFLLTKLKILMQTKKARNFKLVLMSAALDVDLFVKYFDNCPLIKIPGRMFEVEEYFLGDILKSTGYLDKKVDKSSGQKYEMAREFESLELGNGDSSKDEKSSSPKPAGVSREVDKILYDIWHDSGINSFELFVNCVEKGRCSVNYQHSETGFTALMAVAARGRIGDVERLLSCGADVNIIGPGALSAVAVARQAGQSEIADYIEAFKWESCDINYRQDSDDKKLLKLYNQHFDDEKVNCDIILCLLLKICRESNEGSILIFLPGYDDIVTIRDVILCDSDITNYFDIRLFTLHSAMQTSDDQKQIFHKVPLGSRKIILATNIAESAITIDDVVYVIDSGKVKIRSYEAFTSTNSLKRVWISKSSSIQRKGRAGRCRPGICYHLFSRSRYNAMPQHQPPELLRTPLEELCLQIKLLDGQIGCSISKFFQHAPEPPPDIMVNNAVELLKMIDALDSQEMLTDLGYHLVDLPIDPRLGKMVLYGVVLKCLDPVLTIACSLSYKNPFLIPSEMHAKKQAFDSKVKLSAGTYSDHMCLLRAFQAWQKARSYGWEQSFCRDNFMSQATMEMIVGMRSQLLGQLRAIGFVRARGGNDIRDLNTNSENWAVVKATLCASMYPNLLHIDRKSNRMHSQHLKKVRFHNSSILSKYGHNKETSLKSLPSDWFIFDEMTRSAWGNHAVCCTSISSLCVALFAGPSYLQESECVVYPDIGEDRHIQDSDSETEECSVNKMSTFSASQWIRLNMDPHLAPMIVQLRTKWFSLFSRRIKNPSKPWQPEDEAVLNSIINILSSEDQVIGLSQPSGIGQRPRPVSQDEGGKLFNLMPRNKKSPRSRKDDRWSVKKKSPSLMSPFTLNGNGDNGESSFETSNQR